MTTKRERREALARMTKAELVKTVLTLDARQTKLLNEIAGLRSQLVTATDTSGAETMRGARDIGMVFPWEQS